MSGQETTKKLTVFFSWQSDLPRETNHQVIKSALREAASRLETEFLSEHLSVLPDEATDRLPGSPSIPQAIFNKIDNADVFIADVTTINHDRPEGTRATANPNVTLELGYAVARLSWARIILLYNRNYGDFPKDIPFDYANQRLSPYSIDKPKEGISIKQAKQRSKEQQLILSDLLFNALKAIYEQNPILPGHADEVDPPKRRRVEDLKWIARAMSTIHAPTLDRFYDNIDDGFLIAEIDYYWEKFDDMISDSLFHIHDPTLSDLLQSFYINMKGVFALRYRFKRVSGQEGSSFQELDLLSDKDHQDWGMVQSRAKAAYTYYKQLLNHIRLKYIEIDLEECSDNALRSYKTFKNTPLD